MHRQMFLFGILLVLGLAGASNANSGIGGWNATTPVTFGPYICVNYTATLYCSDSLHWYTTSLSAAGIGPWKEINSTFPQTLQGCDGQGTYNGYFYCFSHNLARTPVAYYAKINASYLGNWTQIPTPSTFASSQGTGRYACAFYFEGGEFVYCTAENVNSNAAYYAKVNSTGGVGPWNASTPIGVTAFGYPSSFGQYFGVIGNNTLYYGTSGTADINFVNLTGTGVLEGYGTTTSFPNSYVACSYYDKYLYCVDSNNNTEYTSPVISPVGLGVFNTTTPFPSGVTPFLGSETTAQQWGIIVHNYIYDLVLSGSSYYAKITNSTPPSLPSVSISPSAQSEDAGQRISINSTIAGAGSGGDTYQWYNGTSPIAGQTLASYSATASAAGTFGYHLVVTDSNGGIGTSNTATVTVTASPALSISGTASADTGQQITFTATVSNPGSGSDTISWYNDSTGTGILTSQTGTTFSISSLPAGSYSYYAVATDSNGATGTSNTAHLAVSPLPAVTISPSSQSEDAGQRISINSTIAGAGSGGDTYQWYNGTSPIAGQTLASYSATASAAGTFGYHLVVTDSNGGIGQSNNALVTVNASSQTQCGYTNNSHTDDNHTDDNHMDNNHMDNGKRNSVYVIGNRKNQTVGITNQNYVTIIGSSNNVIIDSNGSCPLTVTVIGSSNRLAVYNGTVFLNVIGSSNQVSLYGSLLTGQEMIGSRNKVIGADFAGNAFTITGSSDQFETIDIGNASQVRITGSSNRLNLVMNGSESLNMAVAGSFNLINLYDGAVALTITGSSDTVNLYNTTTESQSVTGSKDIINNATEGHHIKQRQNDGSGKPNSFKFPSWHWANS